MPLLRLGTPAAALVAVVLLAPQPARALQFKRLAEIRTAAITDLQMLSNRYVWLGADWDRLPGKPNPIAVHYKVLDVPNQKLLDVVFPIQEFLDRHGDVFPLWTAAQLIFFNGPKAALTFARIGKTERTDFFCAWTPGSGADCTLLELGRHGGERLYDFLGADPAEEHLYFAYHVIDPQYPALELFRVRLRDQSIDWRMTLPRGHGKATRPPDISKRAISFDGQKIALVEHTEKRAPGNPQVYVVDIPSKTFAAYSIPVSCYGITFSRDGKYLVLGSQELGQIVRVNLAEKKLDLETQGMKKVQLFFETPSGSAFYVFADHLGGPKPIEVRAWANLRRRQSIPMRELFPGIDGVHPTGMVSTRDGKLLVTPIFQEGGFAGENQGVYVFAVQE